MGIDVVSFSVSLGLVAVTMLVIKYACDQFEPAADYLGRNMAPGVKGASINAIGSSMPEFLTSMAFLFTITQVEVAEGLLASVAVTAGSAIFNAVIIPAVVILAVTVIGIKNTDGQRERVAGIAVRDRTIFRDGFFLLAAEGILIWLLGFPVLSWWTGALLIATYVVYFTVLMYPSGINGGGEEEEGEEDEDEDEGPKKLWKMILTFDFISLFFKGRAFTNGMAWGVLGLSVLVLAVACHVLAQAVVMSAHALQVPLYFTSVILAAAATSVPDTILSVKDARKGNYDDAVSNALGSNIFDITICTGVPLLLYTLLFGAIDMAGVAYLESDVQFLRVVLFGITLAVGATFLFPRGRTVGTGKAILLLALYSGWITWIIMSARSQ